MRTLAETRLARVGFLSEAERDVLSQIVLPTRVLRPGEDLIREDSWPLDIYPLIAGWAYRYITVRDEVRQTSALLIPGDICNLDNLLFDRADCGVQALTSATVLVFPREQALELTNSYPGIGRAFTWLALAENAILNQWNVGLGRRRPEERLAHLLCELRIRSAIAPNGNETSFEIPVDYQVIGDAIGVAPDVVRQTMEVLVQQGLIARTGNHVTVRQLERLQALAGFNPSYLRQIEKSGYSGSTDATVRSAANSNDTVTPESQRLHDQSIDPVSVDGKVSERDLMRREMFHSFKNDLQLIVGLLDLQSRRAEDEIGYRALRDAMERVETLTRARLAAEKDRHPTLHSALVNVCKALETHAEPRSVTISLDVSRDVVLTSRKVSVLALVVNELATNAIKHAFASSGGRVTIKAWQDADTAHIVVDDDGLDLPPRARLKGAGLGLRLQSAQGLGLGLAEQLTNSIGGSLVVPAPPSKAFEIHVPAGAK